MVTNKIKRKLVPSKNAITLNLPKLELNSEIIKSIIINTANIYQIITKKTKISVLKWQLFLP